LFATQGLWRYEPVTGRFSSFGPQDGLRDSQFNTDTSAMLASGTIYAATKGGVIGFSPERLATQRPLPVAPKVVLSAVTIHRAGRSETLPFDGHAPLRLGWRDADLRIEARMSSFVDPAANHYRFRLQGFDPGWVDVGVHGQREFAGLSAGDYQLDIRAAGPAGVWGSLAQPLRIHIEAPPWQRWWAWLIYAIALIVLAWACLRIWQRRMRQRHALQLIEQRSQLAEQASAAKTQFLATLSHEIRTPMTGVMGMAELLLTTPLDATQRGYTHAMQRSGAMLLKLLNETLDLARIEAGRLELEQVPFDPRQLVADVVQLEQGLAQAKRLYLEVELSEQLPPLLLGDVLRIKQVLLNLTSNAMKFTEHGGVTLRVAPVAGGVKFSVQDTGPGIAEASQARLFQRFEQVAGPQRHSGSGLGLAICRELVGLMEGSIELESRMGFGSTFHVRLPLDEVLDVSPVLASPSAAAANATYSILLVEDDEIVAAVIRGLLERQGHRINYVGNGLAALAEISQHTFDVILLDLDLPGVDGFQIARLIRQREGGTRRTPLIAITARAGGDEERRSLQSGMDGFLRKPLSGEQLAQILAEIVTRVAGMADPA
jgi:signal transduction histidine kinase/ActR/RegA family two-component response regulator